MPTENQAAGPERASLDVAALRAAVVRAGGLWRSVEVTPVTGSTNADLLARAAAGEPEGAVLVAEQQDAGRGRLGRAWVSPPRAALIFSVLLRPAAVPRALLGWLPLLAGVAVAAAVRDVAAVDAQLKWPNDVLAGPAMLAGILAGLERRYRTWSRVSGDPERSGLRAEYTGLCATLGRRVRVELPGGRLLDGLAAGVDPDGRLLVSVPPDPDLAVAAGDIVHLR